MNRKINHSEKNNWRKFEGMDNNTVSAHQLLQEKKHQEDIKVLVQLEI